MNILFLAHRVPFPPNKGEKIRTFNQLKHLKKLGHCISVCAPLEQDDDVDFFQTLEQKYCNEAVYSPLTNKPLRLIKGLLAGKALSVANFYTSSLQTQLDNLIAQSAFDAVICTSSAMAEYIYKSSTYKSLKKQPMLLMDFMDLDSDKWQQYAGTSSWPMKWVYKREAKLLAQYERKITLDFDCSFFIANAEVELFNLQANAFTVKTGRVLTMGNGMDTDSFVPATTSPNNEAPVFLFTGVMDYKPNIDAVEWFVTKIWQSIVTKYPKARFIIAGMNPSSLVQDLEKTQGIEVTGFVDDILPYYHQSDYFVAPFRLARGVQNKVLQGFACGLPVISTPMGAEGIDCEKNRDILIASTRDEFLACIALLEADKGFKDKIIKNALSLIHDHYSWGGKLQVLDDVLNGNV